MTIFLTYDIGLPFEIFLYKNQWLAKVKCAFDELTEDYIIKMLTTLNIYK